MTPRAFLPRHNGSPWWLTPKCIHSMFGESFTPRCQCFMHTWREDLQWLHNYKSGYNSLTSTLWQFSARPAEDFCSYRSHATYLKKKRYSTALMRPSCDSRVARNYLTVMQKLSRISRFCGYSRKFSSEIWRRGTVVSTSEQSGKVFSTKIVFSTNSRESFLLQKFLAI